MFSLRWLPLFGRVRDGRAYSRVEAVFAKAVNGIFGDIGERIVGSI